jgi:hypothetical protein
MVLLDMIAARYLPSLLGWIFLLFVLVSESLIMSKFLKKGWFHKEIYITVILSNVVTTILGCFLINEVPKAGHLLSWIPFFYYNGLPTHLDDTIRVIVICFVITLLIEMVINILLLRKLKMADKLVYGSIICNVFTYVVAAVILLTFGANLLE